METQHDPDLRTVLAGDLRSVLAGDLRSVLAGDLRSVLAAYEPRSPVEAADVERMRGLASDPDPWGRSSLLHATASAIVVHPPSGRVLLRWHARMGSWLHVGGHGDPGERHPFAVALREAREETALSDLAPWPDPTQPHLVHVAIVPVPANAVEPRHEHGDLRYALSTDRPDDVAPEDPSGRLRWLSLAAATDAVAEDNLRDTLARVAALLG